MTLQLENNPMQKSRAKYVTLDEDHGWLFIWGQHGFDPEKNQWYEKLTETQWRQCPPEAVPTQILESRFIFFSKAKTL
jgi:hypothetical protein